MSILLFFTILLGGLGMNFTIETSAFQNGAEIPKRYTADGADLSPPLKWKNPPPNTKSFALICDDPDAPHGTWVHWVLYNIPKEVSSLPEGVAKKEQLPDNSEQGINDFMRTGYWGPSPPRGAAHRYFFTLFALDCMLTLGPKATKADLEKAIHGHVLEKTSFFGLYQRKIP
jgi:Raf kinase inhibitor-like YbhB/YbcL family protein